MKLQKSVNYKINEQKTESHTNKKSSFHHHSQVLGIYS